MTADTGPNGAEWTIRHGEHEARVVAVGGALRTYTHGGVDVVAGFGADEPSPAMRGKLLAPWPNRLRDGRYAFEGRDAVLALTEPDRHNAAHGLVLWQPWEAVGVTDAAVTLQTVLYPQLGYDARLTLRVTYEVGDAGLKVTPWARNDSALAAPFGFASHPYLTAGEDRVDDLEITVPAGAYLPVDEERLLPAGDVTPVDDLHRLDGRALGERDLDTAFTGVRADADGRWRVHLHAPATGRRTVLWADASVYPWIQVFTGGALPEPARRRTGVAVEPMTCPPDAFNGGIDVVRLGPGDTWTGPWGVTPG